MLILLTLYQFPTSEVQGYRDQLDEIKTHMVDGKFLSAGGIPLSDQDIVSGLLNRCVMWSEIVLDRYEHSRLYATSHAHLR